MNFTLREEWLCAAVDKLRPLIEANEGITLPPVYLSMGFSPRSARTAFGSCTHRTCGGDGRNHIFISPMLVEAGGEQGVLATLLHELCHACLPDKTGHRAPFARLAEGVGLEPPWTATTASPALLATLSGIEKTLGPLPHATCNPFTQAKKQTTRMIKCSCPSCGYTCRTTRSWLDEAGPPLCPCNERAMEEDNG